MNFNFLLENSTKKREKLMVDETFCTLVTVGGKYLKKNEFRKVLKKIDDIRRIIRI